MPDLLEKARRYRDKAQELRAIAQQWIGTDSRATISEVAKQYEVMADRLEQRAANADDSPGLRTH